jgi:Protein of unknown function (DUF559)
MDIVRSRHDGTAVGRISIRDGNWTTPLPGARVRGDVPLTHRLLAEAAVAISDRLAVTCDLTAAYLWSVAVPSGFGIEVDAQACAVATSPGGSRHRSEGLRGRRLELPPTHVTALDGITITVPARTWIDCAPLVSYADVVAMGDTILRSGLATRAELSAMVSWGRGRRGIRAARRALPVLDPGAESPPESWVRALLMDDGIPRPTCNLEVSVDGWTFRLDLAWPDRKVAVEYDGEEHHGPDRARHDRWRRALLRQAGWTVIVVRKSDFADFGSVVAAVRTSLRA